MSEDNKKVCLYLNKGEMVELMSFPPLSVMKAKTDIAKMMKILRNRYYPLFDKKPLW